MEDTANVYGIKCGENNLKCTWLDVLMLIMLTEELVFSNLAPSLLSVTLVKRSLLSQDRKLKLRRSAKNLLISLKDRL